MKVRLKHGTCKYNGTYLVVGEAVEISENFYHSNAQRFEKVVEAQKSVTTAPVEPVKTVEKVVQNIEPTETKSEAAKTPAKRKRKPASKKASI